MFDGSFGQIVTVLIGVGAMIAAIMVPFRMGGFVLKAVANLAKMGALSGRLGVAGMAETKYNEDQGGARGWLAKNVGNRVARGAHKVAPLLFTPDIFMEARKRREATLMGEGKKMAAAQGWMNQETLYGALNEHEVAEKVKEDGLKEMSPTEHAEYQIKAANAGDSVASQASWDTGLEHYGRSKFIIAYNEKLAQYRELVKNTAAGKARDEAKKKYREVLFAIGAIDNKSMKMEDLFETQKIKGEDGIEKEVEVLKKGLTNRVLDVDKNGNAKIQEHGQAFAALNLASLGVKLDAEGNLKNPKNLQQKYLMKRRIRYDKLAEKQQFHDEARTIFTNSDGSYRLGSKAEIAMGGSGAAGDVEPQQWNRSINASAIVKDGELDDTILAGMLEGTIGINKLKEAGRMKEEGVEAFRKVLRGKTVDENGVEIGKFEKNLKKIKKGGTVYNYFVEEKAKEHMRMLGLSQVDANNRAQEEADLQVAKATIVLEGFRDFATTNKADAAYLAAAAKYVTVDPDYVAPPPPKSKKKPDPKLADGETFYGENFF